VLRLGFGLLYWTGKPLTHDEREYLALATNLASGRGFTHDLPGEPATEQVQRFGRAPLYPLFLAPLARFDPSLRASRMPGDVPAAVKIVQAFVGAAGVLFIGLIGARLSPAAGQLSAAIASVYPPLVWIPAYALSEALYSTLALACAWVLGGVTDGSAWATGASPARSASPARLLTAGGLAGLAILTRPAMLLFLPLAVVLIMWRLRTTRSGVVAVAMFIAATVLVIAPWTMRNRLTTGHFVLVASEGGITFWTGNHREARGEGDLAANPHLKRRNLELRARHRGLTEEQLEAIYYREAIGFIVEDPIRWLGLLAKKLFYTWVPLGPSYRLHSPRYFWVAVVSYSVLFPFALAGFASSLRTGAPWALLALAASAVLACVIFFPQERFRIPIIDPTLIVCAGALARRSR
jgi:hypothetical protein